MKKSILLLVLMAPALMAQQPPRPSARIINRVERRQAPTTSDIYCSGFLSKKPVSLRNYVGGGKDTPDTTLYGSRETLFLNGSGYEVNQLYSVVREVRDLNEYEAFSGQHAALNEAGQPYGDLGRVRILKVEDKGAIAQVELSCQPISPGDLVIPFHERPPVSYREQKVALDQFPATSGKLSARIVLSKDFDMFVGAGSKVYINAGSDKGVKVGDYFRVISGYKPDEMDSAQALSYLSPQAETDVQKNTQMYGKTGADLPRRALGEMIVLCVTPTSSTAMITLSLDTIKVGDPVELEAPPQ